MDPVGEVSCRKGSGAFCDRRWLELPLSLEAVGLAGSLLQVLRSETSSSERCAGGMAHETPLHPRGAEKGLGGLLRVS